MNKEVLVVGDIILDKYLIGDCYRISPEAPVQIVKKSKQNHIIGGAGNVAVNLANIGIKSKLVSIVGDDSSGRRINKIISGINNLEFRPLVCNRITTKKTRIVVNGQQLLRIDDEETNDINEKEEFDLLSIIKEILENNNIKLVVISDYNKGILTNNFIKNLLKLCNEYKVSSFLDPKSKDFKKYNGVTLIKPNEKEAIESCSFDLNKISIKNDDQLIMVAKEINENSGARYVLITLSDQGAVLIDTKSLKIFKAFSDKIDVYDVTGAGDTFLSVFSYFHVKGLELDKCLLLANKASSISVSKRGNYVITKDDIINISK